MDPLEYKKLCPDGVHSTAFVALSGDTVFASGAKQFDVRHLWSARIDDLSARVAVPHTIGRADLLAAVQSAVAADERQSVYAGQ